MINGQGNEAGVILFNTVWSTAEIMSASDRSPSPYKGTHNTPMKERYSPLSHSFKYENRRLLLQPQSQIPSIRHYSCLF